jgi:indole-3-glycerol phosphate synthase
VPSGDPAGIADGIVRVLAEPDRYRPSAALVRAVFDPQDSLKEYEALMTRVLRRRRDDPHELGR